VDTTVHIWDASDSGHAYICRPHTARVSALAWLFSYNARIVSASADTSVKIWEKK
jgi:WD40 repeat protein